MLHRALRPGSLRLARNRQPAAFTLAELLIVVAIIAVLISILLPTLGAARRSANSAKCLAALRDLGLAFQQYAQDNKRAFPVVEYAPPVSHIVPTGAPARRPWSDFLVKYIHRTDPNGDLKRFKGTGSTLFGCPSFEADLWFQPATDPGVAVFNPIVGNKFNTGYGMQRYPLAPHSPTPPAPPGSPAVITGTAAAPGNNAIIRDPVVFGSFFKMEKWGVRAAERGLLADCNTYDLIGSGSWSKTANIGTGTSDKRCDPFIGSGTPSGTSWISVDGMRHVAPSNNQKKIFNTKGVNMLFVDGHATSVNPEEAWIAIRGGGLDIRQ